MKKVSLNFARKLYPLMVISLLAAFFASCGDDLNLPPTPDESIPNPPELYIVGYDGGEVEWVSIQGSTSADSKVADAKQDRNDIVRSNDTLFIQLWNVSNDTIPFTQTGKFIVVLKHSQSDKMYIRGVLNAKAEFENGKAITKWGGWLGWK